MVQPRTHIGADVVPAQLRPACNRSLSTADRSAPQWPPWGSWFYSTWTPYTKPTHKRSQNTARVTRSSRKCNQELLPLTASNQENVPPNCNVMSLPRDIQNCILSKGLTYLPMSGCLHNGEFCFSAYKHSFRSRYNAASCKRAFARHVRPRPCHFPCVILPLFTETASP